MKPQGRYNSVEEMNADLQYHATNGPWVVVICFDYGVDYRCGYWCDFPLEVWGSENVPDHHEIHRYRCPCCGKGLSIAVEHERPVRPDWGTPESGVYDYAYLRSLNLQHTT